MGEHVHVSGTTARDPFLDGCDAYQQAKAALEIIEVGLRLDAVVRTVSALIDPRMKTEIEAYAIEPGRWRPPTRPGRRS